MKIGNKGVIGEATVTTVQENGMLRINTDPSKPIRPDGEFNMGFGGFDDQMFRGSDGWFKIVPIRAVRNI